MSEEPKVTRDYSGWIHSAATLLVLGGGMLGLHFDTSSRIDAGKDEQRAHWQAERLHKDSCDKVFQDSVLHMLQRHTK